MTAPALSVTDKETKWPAVCQHQPANDLVRNIVKPFHGYREHRVVPPHAEKTKPNGRGEDMSLALRTLTERRSQKVTKAHTTSAIATALQEAFRDKSAPIARVQHIAGVDRNTAAAWYYGRSEPRFHQLINMSREIPELKGEVRRLFAMEADLHPDFERELSALMQRYRR